MSAPPLRVHFGTPEHGWLDVSVSTPDGSYVEHSVSDVPCNSLLLLAEAALRTARGESEAETVPWSLEPVSWHWSWREWGAVLDLSCSPYPSKRSSTEIATVQSPGLVEAITRGLSALERDPVWQHDIQQEVWSWPFPSREVAALRALLDATEREVGTG